MNRTPQQRSLTSSPSPKPSSQLHHRRRPPTRLPSPISTSTTRAIANKDGQPPEITTIHGLRVQKRRAVPCRHPRRGGTRQNRYSTDRRDLPSAHRHPSTPSRPRHTPQESPSQPAGRSSSARTTPGSSSCTPQHSPEPR